MRTGAWLLSTVLLASGSAAGAVAGPTVVTGATGRTGQLVYQLLKSKGLPVRAFVRNATKAKAILGCDKCDQSEGVYVGDITEPATLGPVMQGAGALVITTSASPTCKAFLVDCKYSKGAEPIDIDWHGAQAQLNAFAAATQGQGQVVLISTIGTTRPDNLNDDKMGHISFYKLNFEAELMASTLPFTIVKPCGLIDAGGLVPKPHSLMTYHDDEKNGLLVITRTDVARVIVAAVEQPQVSARLRFDLCTKIGLPTKDEELPDLLRSARLPWDHSGVETEVTV